MKHQKSARLITSLFAVMLAALSSSLSLADEASDFVDDASAKGIAEIHTARLALEKSKSNDVQQFAQKMVKDHTSANQDLAQLADRENIEVSDEATLMDKAKAYILKYRDGADFDSAYANNQVMAHEATIEIFRDYEKNGENAALKAFATKTLPTLEHHLKMARELQASHPEPD